MFFLDFTLISRENLTELKQYFKPIIPQTMQSELRIMFRVLRMLKERFLLRISINNLTIIRIYSGINALKNSAMLTKFRFI